jgi:hypothetical protein
MADVFRESALQLNASFKGLRKKNPASDAMTNAPPAAEGATNIPSTSGSMASDQLPCSFGKINLTISRAVPSSDMVADIFISMPAAAGSFRFLFPDRFQLCDFDLKLRRALHQVFPRKGLWPFCGELIIQRHRIMIVLQNEIIADGQVQPFLDDQSVLDGAGNRPDVHDFCGFNGI